MHFIEKIKLKRRELNMYILRDEINTNWIEEKINNHLGRNPHLNLTTEDIKKRILEDDLIASLFIKDPGKQNISEQAMVEVLKSIKIIQNATNLPKSGPKAKYLVQGIVINKAPSNFKTMDFTFNYKNFEGVATLKYTNEAGGAQDNQFNDVYHFLENASIENPNLLTLAIVDGNYYTEEKITILKNIHNHKNIIICSCLELEEILKNEY